MLRVPADGPSGRVPQTDFHSMVNNKKQDKAQLKFIDELLQRPENQNCADCKVRGPRWASINIGCFLCIRCAGIHRKLGTHISKIKSTNLDTWHPDWLEFVASMGNEKVNQIYLAKGSPSVNQQSDSDMDEFIRNKYEKNLYAAKNHGLSYQQQEAQSSQSSQSSASYYARQLETMASMGFTNQAACISALQNSKGSIERAVESMVGKSPVLGSPPRLEEQRRSPPQKTLPDPKSTYQIQLSNMGFSNLEMNEMAFQNANGNMETTVSLLIEWQASNKRKSMDTPVSKQQMPPTSFSKPSTNASAKNTPATADLIDIFGSSSQKQAIIDTSGGFNNQANSFNFMSQNQIQNGNSHQMNPFQQQLMFAPQQTIYQPDQATFQAHQAPYRPQPAQASIPAPQAPFQPNQASIPAPQAPFQPNQASSIPFQFQQQEVKNPFQSMQANQVTQAQQQPPFINPQLMLFQQPIKPITSGMESNDDLFKIPHPIATTQNVSYQNQVAPLQQSQQNNQNQFDYSASQLFGGVIQGGQFQQIQMQSNPFQIEHQNHPSIQDPQERLLQDQKNEFEQKKNRETQKDSILSMYRAVPQQQPAFNGNFGTQQNTFNNNSGNSNNFMLNNQGYGTSGMMHQQSFGYGNQSQMMQPYGNANIYEPRMAAINSAPRQAPPSKPDMAGDIFKAASNSQTNLNFNRVQDKSSNLLSDLNLFGK